MIEYIENGHKYAFSYSWLRADYEKFVAMSDEEFVENILDVLHCAIYICYIKEIETYRCLSDEGIVHQLIHILDPNIRSDIDLQQVRESFKTVCELVR